MTVANPTILKRLNNNHKILISIIKLIKDLAFILYPNYCRSCGLILDNTNEIICFECRLQLPFTDFHELSDNPVERLFYGRIPLFSATAMFRFRKEGSIQVILHSLKYHNDPKIGVVLGRQYGLILREEPRFNTCTMILPVPLHPQRERKRGYNQSLKFAEGLSQSMGIPVYSDILVKQIKTETQTRKSAFKRWENVKTVFSLLSSERLVNQHVLLVDDVITTGSTLESCAQLLMNESNCSISIASIALAGHSF